MIGEETGRKVTPVEAATRMRPLRDETGNRKFGKGEWLTPQQITSYFSRLAAMKKKSAAIACLEEEDAEAVVELSQRYNLRQRIINNKLASL